MASDAQMAPAAVLDRWTECGGNPELQRSADSGLYGQVPAHTASPRVLALQLYGVVTAWLIYVIVVPILWLKIGNITILLMPTVGAFLYSWFGFLYHELFHN